MEYDIEYEPPTENEIEGDTNNRRRRLRRLIAAKGETRADKPEHQTIDTSLIKIAKDMNAIQFYVPPEGGEKLSTFIQRHKSIKENLVHHFREVNNLPPTDDAAMSVDDTIACIHKFEQKQMEVCINLCTNCNEARIGSSRQEITVADVNVTHFCFLRTTTWTPCHCLTNSLV